MPIQNLHFPLASLYHFDLLRERPAHCVHRLVAGEQRFILKSFISYQPAKEIQVYALLESLGVPTLPVHLRSSSFLLLEDLESNPDWRLAQPEDMRQEQVGRAVGAWYRRLHQAGRLVVQRAGWPAYLHSWIDPLEEQALWQAGRKLGLEQVPAWQKALGRLEEWKAAYRAFPQTFNYSDFAAENLALSRQASRQPGGQPLQAIVFDYDCFTTGSVYSDVRNVIFSLEGPARGAFQEVYGPWDPAEEIVDTPLSTLEGILVASQREHIPGWARPLIEAVKSGTIV
jgi:hypothetical protein